MDISSIFSTPSILDNLLNITNPIYTVLNNSLVPSDSVATVLDNSLNLINPVAPILDNFLIIADSMVMHSKIEFLEQVELTCSSLQQFIAIQDFENAGEIKRGALNKLIKNTVRSFFHIFFHSFY